MNNDFKFLNNKVAEQSDLEVFAEKTKIIVAKILNEAKNTLLPKMTKLFYKLSIIKDLDEYSPYSKPDHNEYNLKVVNALNHAKQVSLLDMAVFTSPEFQESIIEQRTLKEMVIDFQVIKSRLFVENRSVKGNFIYEGALIEQTLKNLDGMTDLLKKIYVDFFREEVYQYHCSSILNLSYDELFDETWMNKVCEKLTTYDMEQEENLEYPKEVLNKFKFIYMLIKVQEIKYDSIVKQRCQN